MPIRGVEDGVVGLLSMPSGSPARTVRCLPLTHIFIVSNRVESSLLWDYWCQATDSDLYRVADIPCSDQVVAGNNLCLQRQGPSGLWLWKALCGHGGGNKQPVPVNGIIYLSHEKVTLSPCH